MGRRLGQYFLARDSVLARIAGAVCPGPGPEPLVIEIGPGHGALTRHLLEKATRVVGIELDGRLASRLREKFADRPALSILEADVLAVDLAAWGPAVVAGNLPYYITSPILEKVLGMGKALVRAVLLMQKEVAERATAGAGSRSYGYLSVLVQTYAEAELLFPVPPAAFRPPPKVDSAVIRLTPHDPAVRWGLDDPAGFVTFAGSCFRQKRKTLRNNLAGRYPKETLDGLPVLQMRAEQLPLPDLIDLYRALAAKAVQAQTRSGRNAG